MHACIVTVCSVILIFYESCSLKESSESLATERGLLKTSSGEVEMERCPNCWKLFPVHELPLHSPICQESFSKRRHSNSSSHSRVEEGAVRSSSPAATRSPPPERWASGDLIEQCPHCLDRFPLDVLISHAETCSLASSTGSSRGSRGSSSGADSAKSRPTAGWDEAAEPPVPPAALLREVSVEQCPYCLKLLPVTELITHCTMCKPTSSSISKISSPGAGGELSSSAADFSDVEADSAIMVANRGRYTLEPFEKPASALFNSSSESSLALPVREGSVSTPREGDCETDGKLRSSAPSDGVVDLEQCVHCLKEFPISELVNHAASCSAAGKGAGAEVRLNYIICAQ